LRELVGREVTPGAGPEVIISPPELTWTLAIGDVVVTASPLSLVDVTTAAGTRVDVVRTSPESSVVVMATSTLSLAELIKAEVVIGTTLPPSSVDEMTMGINTPVCVAPAELSSLSSLLSPVSTALVIAGGVLTIVLPDSSVVVSGGGWDAWDVEDATKDVVLVLPDSSVVVTGTVVPSLALDPVEEDVNSCSSLEDSTLDVTEEAPEDVMVEVLSVALAVLLPPVEASEDVSSAEVSLAVSEAALDLEVSSSLVVVLVGDCWPVVLSGCSVEVVSISLVEVGSADVSRWVVDSSRVLDSSRVVLRAVVEGVGVSVSDGVGDVELSPCEVVLSTSEVATEAAVVDDWPCVDSSSEEVTVVTLTAVVVESVTITAPVVVVPLLLSSWRRRSSAFTIESSRAISASLVASTGLSWCTAFMASWWSSNTPSRYLGPSLLSAARKDSLGTSCTSAWKSAGCAKPVDAKGRASRRMDRNEGMVPSWIQAARDEEEEEEEEWKTVLAGSNAHEREIVESSFADLWHAGVSESQASKAS
jgi:hypothetical protein